ncbi:MAG: cell division transport system permease protein [Solirubrobacteraceae bacterium]|jgi:cell division transport system permease protein|nr:cell division transport system permease protein [Solirubrobacteraceae bacterium]
MHVSFFLRESFRSLKRNAVPSFAAMASVLVTMLVLGVFIPMVQATTGAANDVRSKVLVNVFMKTNATDADVERVRRKLADDTKYVSNVQFVSKAEAYAKEKKQNPEAYALLGSNPLPDTFRITPTSADRSDDLRNLLAPVSANGQRTNVDPAIDEVKDRREETSKILGATHVVKLSMALLASLLILASILLISNTVRLSLFARRREVEVMKLVGATDWFIRWPFVIEGIIVGALGGGMAILLLLVGKIAFIDPLKHDFSLISAPDTINFGLLIIVLMVASVAVSAAGSGLSLRRFLRV